MRQFNLKPAGAIVVVLMMLGFFTTAMALEPTVITFDSGTEGWDANPDCETLPDVGGEHGAVWNFANNDCQGTWYLRAYFDARTSTNPAFIGDYTAKGPVRFSVDVDVDFYDYYVFWSGARFPVELERVLVVEFIDYDHQYVDPDTGYDWPWTSVMLNMGNYQDRTAGWKTFYADIPDPSSTELPEGWIGFGGPEDPNTYISQLPPDYTFADVMAGVDEVVLHSIEPGWFYGISFLHQMNFDNITLKEMPRECQGQEATVWVDNDGMVHGGAYDGMPYAGELTGTWGDDVIVGTMGDDSIQGLGGHDVICGMAGNDDLHGHQGDDIVMGGDGDDNITGQSGHDYLNGGEGRDHINGGPGSDTCIHGEVVNSCGSDGSTRPAVRITPDNTISGTEDGIVNLGTDLTGAVTQSTDEASEPASDISREGRVHVRREQRLGK